jgi:four helix bundle protein
MLKIYPVILQVVKDLAPIVGDIQRHDADLARQMRRALSSVPLNVSEGMYNRGGHRKQRYLTAMGSMRETLGCIETAQAMGYLDEVGDDVLDGIDHVIRVLYNLTNA